MATKSFNDLYDYVIPYLPGAEPGIVDFHIRRTLREFFKRTTVWRERFEFTTIAGTDTYQLTPSVGIVACVLTVHIDGQRTPAPAVPEHRRNALQSPGLPNGWYGLLPQVITLYPRPDVAVPVLIEAAITLPVENTVRTFPAEVFEEHAEAIGAGVIAGMMMMPGKPWSQREVAASYSRIFGAALRDLRGKLRDGGQPNQSTFTAAAKFGV